MSDIEDKIREALKKGDVAAYEHYWRAGEMLLEAKGQIEPLAWGQWLHREFGISQETATRYIELAARHYIDVAKRLSGERREKLQP